MNPSQRAAVWFMDVVASFSREEWDLLEVWKRDLYGNVIRDLHNVLLDLGYHIENSEVLFRIISENKAGKQSLCQEGLGPDILLRIKYEEPRCTSGNVGVPEEGPHVIKMESDFFPQIKQEKESHDISVHHSDQTGGDNLFSTPVFSDTSYSTVTGDTPSTPSPDPALGSPHTTEVKREHEDLNKTTITAKEAGPGLSPNKIRRGSKSPKVESVTSDQSRKRRGIARQIKSVAALHDFDQNKQTWPKEKEVQRVFTNCEVSFVGIKGSFPSPLPGEDIYPYTAVVKGFGKGASIQHRGQAFIMCSVCSKTFYNNSSYQIHMRTHTGERPYKCTNCDKSFNRSSHLKIHLRTHTGERPYKCTACEKSFRDNSSFARHQRIHTGEKPYLCSSCGKYFRKKSNLKDHYRTHTGERPYKCQHCDKSFHQKSNLRVHLRNHHANSC